MAKRLLTLEGTQLTRKERRELRRTYQDALKPEQVERERGANDLPTMGLKVPAGFWSFPVRRPHHRATGFQLAAANVFSAADIYDAAGPIMGIEKLSGGRAFTFDPWELYLQGLVTSPNLLIQGSLRQGKSYFIKRLVSTLVEFGRLAINTSDSKGEHGALAEAIGGTVHRMGVFGDQVRVNPLAAGERRYREGADGGRILESEIEYDARVKAARVSVMQQIAGLLNEGERAVSARESTILDWAIDEVVKETNNRPTIRAVWEKIASPELLTAQNGYFERSDARSLQDGIRRLVHGDLGGMFDTDSSVKLDPDSPYTVIDTFAISQRGSQALAVTQAVTNAWVQNTISNKSAGRRYFLIREEGWRDMKSVQALEAHQEQLKLSGEYGIAMVLIVHEDGDFDSVGSEGSKERDLAKSLLRGYANKISFYQPATTLKESVRTGALTEAEAYAVGTLKRGEFVVKLRDRSYVVNGNPVSTKWERDLFDTDKQMRAKVREMQKEVSNA